MKEPKPPDLAVRPRVVAQHDVPVVGARIVRLQVRTLPDLPEEAPRLFVLVGDAAELDLPSPMPLASVSFPARLVGDVRRALGAIERRAARRPDGGGAREKVSGNRLQDRARTLTHTASKFEGGRVWHEAGRRSRGA